MTQGSDEAGEVIEVGTDTEIEMMEGIEAKDTMIGRIVSVGLRMRTPGLMLAYTTTTKPHWYAEPRETVVPAHHVVIRGTEVVGGSDLAALARNSFHTVIESVEDCAIEVLPRLETMMEIEIWTSPETERKTRQQLPTD